MLPVYVLSFNALPGLVPQTTEELSGNASFSLRFRDIPDSEREGEGHWHCIVACVREALEEEEDMIIITYDDSFLTASFRLPDFIDQVCQAGLMGCNILLGGVEGLHHVVPINSSLYWIDTFTGSCFLVLFRNVYAKILKESYEKGVSVSELLSFVTSHKMVLYPLISERRATAGKVGGRSSQERLALYRKIYEEYVKPNEDV